MRPDLPARSAFTEGKSLSGQRVTRVAGHLPLGSVPGSSQAPGATLIELPGPHGACWISSSCSLVSQVWSCLSRLAPAHPRCPSAAARTWM